MTNNCNCTVAQPLPGTRDVFVHARPSMIVGLFFAAVFTSAGIVLTYRHVRELKKHTATRRRDLYVDIVCVGMVFCITGALAMITPRSYELLDVFQTVYEARVLYDFGFLLINYMAGENVHDPREAKRKCVTALGALPYRRYLAVPPFGFVYLCGPQSTPHQFNKPTIRLVIRCLKQFLYIGPSVSVIVLFLEVSSDRLAGRPELVALALRGISIASIFTAVWGLFILYGATRKLLSHYQTTFKFAAIKGMLLITGTQELVISSYIKIAYNDNDSDDDTHRFTPEFYARFFMSLAVCIEGFVMCLLLIYAFPAVEVEAEYGVSSLSITADYGAVENDAETTQNTVRDA